MKTSMKKFLSILSLLVLTLGVVQAYSPPEESIDQVTYQVSIDVENQAALDIASMTSFHQPVPIPSTHQEWFSSQGEIIDLAVCQVNAENDDGIMDLTSKGLTDIANYQSSKQGRQTIETRNCVRNLLLNYQGGKIRTVPWQRNSHLVLYLNLTN